jgi:hypothetical protein
MLIFEQASLHRFFSDKSLIIRKLANAPEGIINSRVVF